MAMLPGTKADDYPDGEAAAAEWVTLTTHNGTHLDAPWHFHSTMDARLGEARPSITIDEVPLEWCFQPGVKLDFRHFPMATSRAPPMSRPNWRVSATRCSRSTSSS
jgi:kynurenine formamidase